VDEKMESLGRAIALDADRQYFQKRLSLVVKNTNGFLKMMHGEL
jgi:hypothetical protein